MCDLVVFYAKTTMQKTRQNEPESAELDYDQPQEHLLAFIWVVTISVAAQYAFWTFIET